MKEKCQVKCCGQGLWTLYNKDGKYLNNTKYRSKEEAIRAAMLFALETGDELCIYDENNKLIERKRLNYGIGE